MGDDKGETEGVMLKYFIKHTNLCCWISQEGGPETILYCHRYFDTHHLLNFMSEVLDCSSAPTVTAIPGT